MRDNQNRVSASGDKTCSNKEKQGVLSPSTVQAALAYAKDHGFAVFPCVAGEKNPAISGGHKRASSDPKVIKAKIWNTHNLGIRTGSHSGVFVLDVDVPGGYESLKALTDQHGNFPDTVMANTPSGGLHYYFLYPADREVYSTRGDIGSKLDIRAERGYVIAPPSSTKDGSYEWVEGCSPGEVPIAEAPEWLLDRIEEVKSGQGDYSQATGEVLEILEGERNDTLFKEACALRARGWDYDTILAAIESANENLCDDALPDEEVKVIVSSACKYPPGAKKRSAPISAYKAFPVELLPDPIGKFVQSGADTIGCDPAYLALPLLSAIASAIGNSCVIELKNGWKEPSILWTIAIGDSGTMKSPAFRLAIEPARKQQRKAREMAVFDLDKYKQNRQIYERDFRRWNSKKSGDDVPPSEPSKPFVLRTVTEDTTIEALATTLGEQPKGMLIACDELANWFLSFDRYSKSQGGDSSRWLSTYNADELIIDRKTDEPKHLIIPKASVSIAGGIQPGILSRSLNHRLKESGLAARLLFAYPPRKQKQWSEDEMDEILKNQVQKVFDKLYRFGIDKDGKLETFTLRLSREAKKAWIDFFNRHAGELDKQASANAAAFSKLEAIPARLAMIFQLVEWSAKGGKDEVDPVSLDNMQRAIQLTEWFKYEALRIYAYLDGTGLTQQEEKLVQSIREQGGSITPRELHRMDRGTWPDTEAAERELNDLTERGLGNWKTEASGSDGGRPPRKFTLFE